MPGMTNPSMNRRQSMLQNAGLGKPGSATGMGAGGGTSKPAAKAGVSMAKLKPKTSVAGTGGVLKPVSKSDSVSAFGVEHVSKMTKREQRGLVGGGIGGIIGPPGAAIGAGVAAPKGKKGRYAALGAVGGFGGPVGGAAAGYLAGGAKKKRK